MVENIIIEIWIQIRNIYLTFQRKQVLKPLSQKKKTQKLRTWAKPFVLV